MTPDQSSEVLELLAAANVLNRLDPRGPELWEAALADLDYHDALQAAANLIQTQQWVKIADLKNAVHAMRTGRARTVIDDGNPDESPTEFLARRRQLERAAGDGHLATVTPLRAIGRAPASGPADLTEDDVSAMRRQRDLKTFMKQAHQDAHAENTRRKQLVARYPDLADLLAEIPGQKQWTGYLAPATWNGAPNTSPIRAQIAAIVAEAEQRAETEATA